ncbi:MAG: EpsI family protein [Rubrivivax sp.]|nr:EpsI family protein [Rubrivivax sp.]
MSAARVKALVALLLMVVAFVAGEAWRPTKHLSDQQAKVDLEAMFPKAFGDWAVDTRQPVQLVSPDTQALLDKLYNQVLSRTYVNQRNGQRIMLSVAYGGDQSDGTRAHRPEICYPAQGFEVIANHEARLQAEGGAVRVRQLVARQGGRIEPISYWVTVGDRIALGPGEQKLAQLRFGIAGYIADGMLVRISNIDRDAEKSWALHQDFFGGMTQAMSPPVLARVIGVPGG